jgi:hypothetical protein
MIEYMEAVVEAPRWILLAIGLGLYLCGLGLHPLVNKLFGVKSD